MPDIQSGDSIPAVTLNLGDPCAPQRETGVSCPVKTSKIAELHDQGLRRCDQKKLKSSFGRGVYMKSSV